MLALTVGVEAIRFDGRSMIATLGVWSVLGLVPCTWGLAGVAQAQASAQPGNRIRFDIPDQSLEVALRQYSQLAGVEVLYSATLVMRKRSQAIQGVYTRQEALDLLLRGTGLRARYAGATAITLTAIGSQEDGKLAIDTIRVEAAPILIDRRRFTAYGERLLIEIADAIRQSPDAGRGDYQVTLKVWVGDDGAILRSILASSTRRDIQPSTIERAILGLGRGTPPPAGMPQPIHYSFHIRSKR